MTDLVKDAAAYVKGHKPDDVHPDVAARMAGFTRAQDKRPGGAAELAEARALLDAVRTLGDGNVPPTADDSEVRRPRPAKRAAAKKATAKKATARRKA